jgi:hypothetical protein
MKGGGIRWRGLEEAVVEVVVGVVSSGSMVSECEVADGDMSNE